MSNKQSSIEWFAERIKSDKIFSFEKVLEQAKAMHKQEIEEAWKSDRQFVFFDSEKDELSESTLDSLSENYYNETFE